jgi:chloramphenicol 3-O-phosphotransferase
MSARILVLTGPSSVGKTCALEALQRVARTPSVVLPADLFSLPSDARARSILQASDASVSVAVHRALFQAYYRTLVEWQRQGFHALGETIFKDRHQVEAYRETLDGAPHALVRLTCSREARHARETGRSDRSQGLSDETARQELTDLPADHTVDTTDLSPEDVASNLLPLLESPPGAR